MLAIASTLRLRHEKYYQSGQLNTKYSTHKEGRYTTTTEKSGLRYLPPSKKEATSRPKKHTFFPYC